MAGCIAQADAAGATASESAGNYCRPPRWRRRDGCLQRSSAIENPALQAVLMALETREDVGALTETWRRWGHEIGFGIGIAHGFATLGTIGFEGRFDYAAIGTVSNVASRLCDEAKPGQILISPRVLTKVENAVQVEPVGEFELKGIRRPLAAYNVLDAL
jgi:adenylate cyclase